MKQENKTRRQAQEAISKAADAIKAANQALNEANEALRLLSMDELEQVSGGVIGEDAGNGGASCGWDGGSEWNDVPTVNENPYPPNP